jgi:regulator of protease activity HflC (stomatin/prohibitin superfamily)
VGYIVFMLVLLVFTVGGALVAPPLLDALFGESDSMRNEASRQRAQRLRTMIVRTAFVGVLVIVGGIATVTRSVQVVEAGHVGLVYRFGDIVGQRDAGLSLIWPWETFRTADIRIQAVRPVGQCANGEDDCLAAFSAETQDVFVLATLNISINPTDVQDLYRTVGPAYVDKIVRPRLLQTFKDETVKFNSVDIAPNREDIRAAVLARLRTELSDFSINVTDLLIDNIDFRPEFKQAIESKQVATQEALRQQALVAAREAEARQAAAQAQGVADRLRIEAEGQATANRSINESLTPLLIQFQALQKLSDNVQIALVPSGSGLLIDPSTLLQGATTGNQ